jgi:hypothetical protein
VKQLARKIIRRAGFDLIRYSPTSDVSAEQRIEKRGELTLTQLRDAVMGYIDSMRLSRGGELLGYKFSACSPTVTLYGTVACVLLRHLLSFGRSPVEEEIRLIKLAQGENGLLYDSAIDSPLAWQEDWWGYRHLTLLCIMALALYDEPCNYPVDQLPAFVSANYFSQVIAGGDWGKRVSFTSNMLQNYGVFLQYARDFQGSTKAAKLCTMLFENLDRRVDPNTGLWGNLDLKNPALRSEAVQAAYHFWLLYFYEKTMPPYIENAIEWILATQNPCGGYGVMWNSSCCESIDSIDPLARLLKTSASHTVQIERSLERAVADAITALNGDGGFTFRRGEAMAYGDSASTYQPFDQSSTFFTWFRMLSIALATQALGRGLAGEPPVWTWKGVPGLQLW